MRLTNIKKQKKKYKALILDVDGTLIPNKRDGMPSKKVAHAIAKASKIIHIGVATSRPYFMLDHIVEHLKLSGPSIINGGAQIINATSIKTLWQQPLNVNDIKAIFHIATNYAIPFIVNEHDRELPLSADYIPKKPLAIYAVDLTHSVADSLIKEFSDISTISVHKVPGWKKDTVAVTVSHGNATKQHAILEVAKLLKIETHEIIGVGDGYNDFPLLMACGLKIAMGNAVDELKAIADYIAPSVEEDGAADVIEKFVL